MPFLIPNFYIQQQTVNGPKSVNNLSCVELITTSKCLCCEVKTSQTDTALWSSEKLSEAGIYILITKILRQ
jgi:hypothetical protein